MKRLNAIGMDVPHGRVIDVFWGKGQDAKFTCMMSAPVFAVLRYFVRGLLKRMPTKAELNQFALMRKGEKKPLELSKTLEECGIRNLEHLERRCGEGVLGSVGEGYQGVCVCEGGGRWKECANEGRD